MAIEIFARLASDSTEAVNLDLPGYASNARAALSGMYSDGWDSQQVTALRTALG